jgi:hypothetical protein
MVPVGRAVHVLIDGELHVKVLSNDIFYIYLLYSAADLCEGDLGVSAPGKKKIIILRVFFL